MRLYVPFATYERNRNVAPRYTAPCLHTLSVEGGGINVIARSGQSISSKAGRASVHEYTFALVWII